MTRTLLNLLSLLSLLLCLAMVALWARSYRARDMASRARVSVARIDAETLTLGTLRGGLQLEWHRLTTRLYRDPDLHRLGTATYAWTLDQPARSEPEWTEPRTPPPTFIGCSFSGPPPEVPTPAPPLAVIDRTVVAGPYVNVTKGATVPFWLVVSAAALVPAARVTGSALGALRRRSVARRGLCPSCAYDLTGNVSGVCPECGARANP